ncbi:MAG: DedA family protein [Oscillospiraceae bacterium]
MQEWIMNFISDYGYFAVLLLIAIENIFPPIPSEVILTFGGFMTTYTDMKIWGVIAFATMGSVLGAFVLYFLGRILNKDRIERILSGKIGKVLHLDADDVEKASVWFNKRGKLTVFFCRFIPIVRSLISIPAGMAKMNFGIFSILTVAGTAIWNIVLVYLGSFAGASWEKIAGYMDKYSLIALAVILIACAIVAYIFIKKRFFGKKDTKD